MVRQARAARVRIAHAAASKLRDPVSESATADLAIPEPMFFHVGASAQFGALQAVSSIVAANGLPHQNLHPSRWRSTLEAPSVRSASA